MEDKLKAYIKQLETRRKQLSNKLKQIDGDDGFFDSYFYRERIIKEILEELEELIKTK